MPKPTLPRWPSRAWQPLAWLGLLSAPLWLASCQAGDSDINPLLWQPFTFLSVYLGAGLLLTAFAALLRWTLRLPDKRRWLEVPLSLEETAYLAGGAQQAVDTALVGLLQRGGVELDIRQKTLSRGQPCAAQTPVETEILTRLARPNRPLDSVRHAVQQRTEHLQRRLCHLGLWADGEHSRQAQRISGWLLFALALFGLVRLANGLLLGRPVGFLVLLLFGNLGLWLYFAKTPLGRSRHGDKVLQHAQRKAQARKNHNADLCQAVALFGLSALAGTALAEALPVLSRTTSGDGGGGDGGSGCGGGGCGGGGCGG